MIVTEPEAEVVARPAAEIEAIFESEELHCAEFVMFLLEPSENFSVAVNGCVAPIAIELEVGEI